MSYTPEELAEVRLSQGERNPYNARPAKDWAEKAAHGVLADLLDRRGIKHAIRQIEGEREIDEEIVVTLAAIIRGATTPAEPR